jgi:hypothetical protein
MKGRVSIPSHDSTIENSLLMVLSDVPSEDLPEPESPSTLSHFPIGMSSLILKALDDLVPQDVERDFFLDGDPF